MNDLVFILFQNEDQSKSDQLTDNIQAEYASTGLISFSHIYEKQELTIPKRILKWKKQATHSHT